MDATVNHNYEIGKWYYESVWQKTEPITLRMDDKPEKPIWDWWYRSMDKTRLGC